MSCGGQARCRRDKVYDRVRISTRANGLRNNKCPRHAYPETPFLKLGAYFATFFLCLLPCDKPIVSSSPFPLPLSLFIPKNQVHPSLNLLDPHWACHALPHSTSRLCSYYIAQDVARSRGRKIPTKLFTPFSGPLSSIRAVLFWTRRISVRCTATRGIWTVYRGWLGEC